MGLGESAVGSVDDMLRVLADASHGQSLTIRVLRSTVMKQLHVQPVLNG